MAQVSIKIKAAHPSWADLCKKTQFTLAEADPDFWHKYLNFTDELYAVVQVRQEIPKTVIEGDMDSNTDILHIIVRQKKYKQQVLKFIESAIQKHHMNNFVTVDVEDIPAT